MKLLQETTSDWKSPTPNHIYIFGSLTMKIIGYIKAGETKAIKFSQPQPFDRRRRTFTQLSAKEVKKFDLGAIV